MDVIYVDKYIYLFLLVAVGGCATAAGEADGRSGNGSAVTSGNVAKADSENGT